MIHSINGKLIAQLLILEAIKLSYVNIARKALSALPEEQKVYRYDGRLISLLRLKSLAKFCEKMAGLEKSREAIHFDRLDAQVVSTSKFDIEGLHLLTHAVKARIPSKNYWGAVQELYYISYKNSLELCDVVKVIETYGVINTICILRRGKK